MATPEKTRDTAVPEKRPQAKEPSDLRRILTLVGGDVLAFLAFAALGRETHGETSGFAALPDIAITAAPFAIGWFLVSPLVGAFRRELMAEPRAMAIRTALAWILSWPIGLALRWLFTGHFPPLSFALVTLIFNLGILLIWRWPYALTNSLNKRQK